jgi:hypothetical protein
LGLPVTTAVVPELVGCGGLADDALAAGVPRLPGVPDARAVAAEGVAVVGEVTVVDGVGDVPSALCTLTVVDGEGPAALGRKAEPAPTPTPTNTSPAAA